MKIAMTLATVAALTLAACAPGANGVEPAAMTGAYDTLQCQKVAGMLAQARKEEAALAQKQNGAATQDAFSVFLLGVPTSALTKSNVQGDLAAAKGRVLALEARQTAC